MARSDQRNPDNAPGDWFIDLRCIDCKASTHVAPGLVEHIGKHCVFVRQPSTDEEIREAWRAVDVCPTQSVGNPRTLARPGRIFPYEVAPGVQLCGHNSESSYGAHSWLVATESGNVMIDSPRYTKRLVDPIDAIGGIQHIMLTHRDDVADADKWAERYGSSVTIHEADARSAPFANRVLTGNDVVTVVPGVEAVPVPGHTRGSIVYLVGERAFTGDSVSWSTDRGALEAFREACWYSWPELIESMVRLAEIPVARMFPGHGSWSPHLGAEKMRAAMSTLIAQMRTQ